MSAKTWEMGHKIKLLRFEAKNLVFAWKMGRSATVAIFTQQESPYLSEFNKTGFNSSGIVQAIYTFQTNSHLPSTPQKKKLW